MAYTYGTPEWEEAYLKMVQQRLATAEKPMVMGSPEWAATYEKMIQEDEEYRKAAKGWEGTVVIHIKANPGLGLDEDIYLLLDLWHGDCRSVRLVPREAGEKGNFILTGELERWEAVTSGNLDPVKAMMQGKVKLKGNLPTIVRYTKASSILTKISTRIEAKLISQLDETKSRKFREEFNALRAEFNF
jgi:putative sterol carrier protein